MKTYKVQHFQTAPQTRVFRNEQDVTAELLFKSCAVVNHSPTGFSYGYAGSGPAQLALAILLDATNAETAEMKHQAFKRDFLQNEERLSFEITERDILRWLAHGIMP